MLSPSSIHSKSHFNPIKSAFKFDAGIFRHIYHALKHVKVEPMPDALKILANKEHGFLELQYSFRFHIRNSMRSFYQHHLHHKEVQDLHDSIDLLSDHTPTVLDVTNLNNQQEQEIIIDRVIIEERTFKIVIKNDDIVFQCEDHLEEETTFMPVTEYFSMARERLSGLNLAGFNLIGIDFNQANLQNTVLIGTNLSGAKMVGANLVGANMQGANLSGADMSVVDLLNAQFDANTNFTDTTVSLLFPPFWGPKELDLYLNPASNPGNLLSVIDSIPNERVKVGLMRDVIKSLTRTNISSVKEAILEIIGGNLIYKQDADIQHFIKFSH